MSQNILICLLVLSSKAQAKALHLHICLCRHLSVTVDGRCCGERRGPIWMEMGQALAPKEQPASLELHVIPFSCVHHELLLRNALEVGGGCPGKWQLWLTVFSSSIRHDSSVGSLGQSSLLSVCPCFLQFLLKLQQLASVLCSDCFLMVFELASSGCCNKFLPH